MKEQKKRRIIALRRIKIALKPGRKIKLLSMIWRIWMILPWTSGNGVKMNSRKHDPASTRLVQRRSHIFARSVTSRSTARASSLVTCSSIATHGRTSARSVPKASRLVRIFLGIWRSTTSQRSFTRALYASSRRARSRI